MFCALNHLLYLGTRAQVGMGWRGFNNLYLFAFEKRVQKAFKKIKICVDCDLRRVREGQDMTKYVH